MNPPLTNLFFALPGSIETRTGGTIYDKRLIAGLRDLGWTIDLAEWPASFPDPSPSDRAAADASLAALPDGTLALIDGLAFGALPQEMARHRARLRLVALVHHPLALESGLDTATQAAFMRSERSALEMATGILVTSHATAAGLVADYAVPATRITVAYPGVEAIVRTSSRSSVRPPGAPPCLLAVGTVSARKGYDLLVAALAQLSDLPWICRVAGSLERDPDTAAALRRQIADMALGHRIELLGEIEDMALEYDAADIFVLPSRHEGYGMAFSEALRHGLPIIGCHAGAIPEVVPPDAGILVAPDNVPTLADAIRLLVTDADHRRHLGLGAYRAGQILPGWPDTARLVDAALRRLL